ncbi:hypothetical protein BD626DRAFT_203790 [Schizophyllum amplum]|uniref:Uncharacterized protein n=1 Tax=Schizophyllum amplum TaxID=97359 RepID=A0A550BZR0_9AGAR|nr:hypothetical protein BD626DRAFT_203790 [Auriculariopsis ampla]
MSIRRSKGSNDVPWPKSTQNATILSIIGTRLLAEGCDGRGDIGDSAFGEFGEVLGSGTGGAQHRRARRKGAHPFCFCVLFLFCVLELTKLRYYPSARRTYCRSPSMCLPPSPLLRSLVAPARPVSRRVCPHYFTVRPRAFQTRTLSVAVSAQHSDPAGRSCECLR